MWIKIAYGCFLVNFIYGILAKFRIIESARFKVVHHGIYFCVMASIIVALLTEFLAGELPIFLMIMAGLLLGMTRFSGKTSRHWKYALVCFAAYSAVLLYYF